jgi:hypothetical protein
MGRTLGFVLIAGGIIVAIVVVALMTVYRNEGSLTGGAAVLGMAIGIIVLSLPQLAFGVYLLSRGQTEAVTAARAGKQRQLLGVVKTRGQVPVSDLAIELQTSRDEVQAMLHELVGMGLFSGYINWEKGVLYSQETSKLRDLNRCLNCNGQLTLAGKGVVTCPYCGTEYFLD